VLPVQQERDLQSESLEALQVRTEELRRELESKPRDRSLALLTMRAALRYARALLANIQRANAALDLVLQVGEGLQRPGEEDHEALALRAWALDLFGDSDAALHEALRALPFGVAAPTAPESAHLLAIVLRERFDAHRRSDDSGRQHAGFAAAAVACHVAELVVEPGA
jgi:hypothetical protein